jgi:hypothetical protein
MSKRATRPSHDDGQLSVEEARGLLNVLCVKYGFCLPPLWSSRLEPNPPRSIDKYLDTVFRAEGLDRTTADSAMYKAMREEVRLAFDRSKASHGAGDL